MIQAISFRGDRSPVPPRVKIGFESDNLVESLAFELPELADDQSAMLMINGNAYANMIDLYRTEDGKWAVDLNAEMVGPAGVYESYVAIASPDGRRWNSGIFDLLTGDLPDVSGAIETLYPTAVEHVLQEMSETRQEMAASVTATEDAAQRAEDAAQRAENAANQGGGGSTAPAKDAVLYTVQELTDEQKTVARSNIGAASVETVSQLYEDKADKADIPAPYTLPVASAETLGGVKIGAGLRMDDDVLSAVGSADSVPVELFSVTLAEMVVEIIAPLKHPAKHMYVLVYPPDDYESTFLVYLYAANCEYLETGGIGDIAITDGTSVSLGADKKRFMCKIDSDAGLVSAYWGVLPESYQSATNYKFLNRPIKHINPEGISTLIIRNIVAGKEFPARATIKVIGA